MPEGESKTTSLPVGTLLALITTVAGVAALLPSKSARPGAPDLTAKSNATVFARLWQDPLTVVRDYVAAEAAKPTPAVTPPEVVKRVPDIRKFALNSKVLVVCEPASPYAEDVERRVRDRAGVIQALAAEDYLPEDSNSIEPLKIKGPPDNYLPCERFYKLGAKEQTVLLVWLTDNELDDRGLLWQLNALSEWFRSYPTEIANPPLDFRVLGPSNSQQYRLMLDEVGKLYPDKTDGNVFEWDDFLDHTHIYPCRVSAPDAELTQELTWVSEYAGDTSTPESGAPFNPFNGRAEKALYRYFHQKRPASQFQIDRTSAADDLLMRAIWKELALRRVEQASKVAVVTELDTFYSRTIADVFDDAGKKQFPLSTNDDSNKGNISHYFYMAGLDGSLPKGALGAAAPASSSDNAKRSDQPPPNDPSEGYSQVDYFRRLASQLALLNRDANADGQRLAAVAVLGSDIYDKLQILRTLRPKLPDTLFVTNYLDARFGHPDEWPETRNLLVAANYDLVPRQEWDSNLPPFRDSNQAATFAAATMALRGEIKEKWLGRPMMFEIGRDYPVCLTPSLEGKRLNHLKIYKPVPAVICLAAALGLIWLLWPKAPKPTASEQSGRSLEGSAQAAPETSVNAFIEQGCRFLAPSHRMIPLALILALVVTWLRYKYQFQWPDRAEPFAFLAGISIWPGDFLRCVLLVLALHFLAKIIHDLKCNRIELEEKFAIIEQDTRKHRGGTGLLGYQRQVRLRPLAARYRDAGGAVNVRRLWAWYRTALVRGCRGFWPQTNCYSVGSNRVDIRRLWRRYRTWMETPHRFGRAALLLALYFCAVMMFCRAISEPLPDLPVRGGAWFGSWAILWVAGIASMLVTFLVVDATELNCRSIRDLNQKRTKWHLDAVDDQPGKFAFARHRQLLEEEDCADYLDIEFIARRTDVVNDLVYYPFILLTITLAARLRITDDYHWPPSIFILLGVNAAWALYCAIRLPIEARKARQQSLKRLRAKLFERQVAESKGVRPARSNAKALEQVIQQIEVMNRGAFVGIWEQPALGALLVPSTSAGLWTLLGLLSR